MPQCRSDQTESVSILAWTRCLVNKSPTHHKNHAVRLQLRPTAAQLTLMQPIRIVHNDLSWQCLRSLAPTCIIITLSIAPTVCIRFRSAAALCPIITVSTYYMFLPASLDLDGRTMTNCCHYQNRKSRARRMRTTKCCHYRSQELFVHNRQSSVTVARPIQQCVRARSPARGLFVFKRKPALP